MSGCLDGGDEEDRTPDLCIANAALSQLSYAPTGEPQFYQRDFCGQRPKVAVETGFNGWQIRGGK